MQKFIPAAFILGMTVAALNAAEAQMPAPRGVSQEIYEHTIREEGAGRKLWTKLQAKETSCEGLGDEDLAVLGEYFMGTMTGDPHAAMNAMMIQMHGEEGEEQIHIVMGKRLSGCDTSATFPAGGFGWMPMMNMMTGGWSSPFSNNSTNNMMNFGFGPVGFLGGLFMVFWWVLIIAAIAALVKWIAGQSKSGGNAAGKSALDILKERYAGGVIDKKEFEERKRDLV